MAALDRAAIARVSLLTAPLLTLGTLSGIVASSAAGALRFALAHLAGCAALAGGVAALAALLRSPPAGLEPAAALVYDHGSFIAYWMTLGVLSSIGLGSGLHTFVLFLGPHIVRVANAALRHGHTGASRAKRAGGGVAGAACVWATRVCAAPCAREPCVCRGVLWVPTVLGTRSARRVTHRRGSLCACVMLTEVHWAPWRAAEITQDTCGAHGCRRRLASWRVLTAAVAAASPASPPTAHAPPYALPTPNRSLLRRDRQLLQAALLVGRARPERGLLAQLRGGRVG